jgi:predicted transposase YdaD
MLDSDSLYHRLFSHPQMVEELVREFVPDAVAAGLDFSRLQRINTKFHVDRESAQRRESDVIWKLPTQKGVDIYLYLLIEFQSDSDWWMAVRAQVYQGLLWQQVIEENKLKSGARLPPVFLLVLYNGQHRWKAPTQVTDLIALPPDSPLWHWQPQVRYYLLDMGAYTGEELVQRPGLASLLFRLEQRQQARELAVVINEVIDWFRQHPDYEQLTELFKELARHAMDTCGVKADTFGKKPLEELEGMKAMLWTFEQSWRDEWRAEGKAEGLVEGEAKGKAEGLTEGKAEGLIEGKAEALVRLLVKRFGPLEPSLHRRIQRADLPTIESWFDRAIDAPDLTTVFGPPGSAHCESAARPSP